MSSLERCPVHAEPDAVLADAWPCPEDCLEWLEKIEYEINEIRVNGNFTRLTVKGGVMWRQVYRNHQPLGDPMLVRIRTQKPRLEE